MSKQKCPKCLSKKVKKMEVGEENVMNVVNNGEYQKIQQRS